MTINYLWIGYLLYLTIVGHKQKEKEEPMHKDVKTQSIQREKNKKNKLFWSLDLFDHPEPEAQQLSRTTPHRARLSVCENTLYFSNSWRQPPRCCCPACMSSKCIKKTVSIHLWLLSMHGLMNEGRREETQRIPRQYNGWINKRCMHTHKKKLAIFSLEK